MSQDKLSPQVTVYVPADRNQSAPQDTAPFVVFPSLLQAPLFYFPFTLILCIFSEAVPKIITVQYLDPFFLLSVITASEL